MEFVMLAKEYVFDVPPCLRLHMGHTVLTQK